MRIHALVTADIKHTYGRLDDTPTYEGQAHWRAGGGAGEVLLRLRAETLARGLQPRTFMVAGYVMALGKTAPLQLQAP